MQHLIAIDIGTTNCKAITMNRDGVVVSSLSSGYSLIENIPGQSEQDPAAVLQAVTTLISQSLNAMPRENFSGVSFSSAMHSVIAVDATGKALTNSITWADTRSKEYAQQLLSHPDADEIYRQTGTPIHPMSPLCKILWMKHEMPGIFEQAHKFISIKEFIFYALFEKYVIDHSLASATGLFDIFEIRWNDKALAAAGITASQLSEPVAVTHMETALTSHYQQLFQLTTPLPFIAGGCDGCLANLGCGAIEAGETALTIGTSGAIRMTSLQVKADDKKRLFNYLLTDHVYISGGPVNNGGNAVQWFTNLFQEKGEAAEPIEDLIDATQAVKPGADGLLFLPYLLGERAPIWDADARAVFFGLSALHKKEQLTKALLEGLCFGLYSILKALEETNGPVGKIYVSGGFIRSKVWVQLLADIFNKPIVISNTSDASATGAAFIGMLALGWIGNLQEVKRFFHEDTTFTCNTAAHNQYAQLFPIFENLYWQVKETFGLLSALQQPG